MAEWHAGDPCQVTEHGAGSKPKPGGRVYPGTVTSAVGEFVHVEAESGMMIGTLSLTFHARSGWLAGPAEGQFQWRLLPAAEAGRTCEADLAEARRKFPPGTRVGAPWKHQGSPVGAVEDGGHTVTDGGVMVRVRFDDGGVMDCPAGQLKWIAAPTLHFPSAPLPDPCMGCGTLLCAECARVAGLTAVHFSPDGLCAFGHQLEEAPRG
jgi:hypothetical protein